MNRSVAIAAFVVLLAGGAALWLMRSDPAPAPDAGPTAQEPVPVGPPPWTDPLLDQAAGLVPPDAVVVYVLRGVQPLLEQTGLAHTLTLPAFAPVQVMLITSLPVDITSPEAIRAAGLDPHRPVVAFIDARSDMLVWLPATDPKAAVDAVVRWVKASGGAIEQDGQDTWVVKGDDLGELAGLVVVPGDGLVALGFATGADPGEEIRAVIEASAKGATAWTERVQPLRDHEPAGALAVVWNADLSDEPPLQFDRSGDPSTDRWLDLVERGANAGAFYKERDSLVTLATPGNGFEMRVASLVDDMAAARAALGGACDVEAAWKANEGTAFRAAGAVRLEDIAPIAEVLMAMQGGDMGSTFGSLGAAWGDSGLTESMWETPGRLRCVAASMSEGDGQLLVAAQIGSGQAEAFGRLLSTLGETMEAGAPGEARALGARTTWRLSDDLSCAYEGDLVACGARDRLGQAMDGIAGTAGKSLVMRMEADLAIFGGMVLDRVEVGAMESLAIRRALAQVGAIQFEESLGDGVATVRIALTGAERPVIGALIETLVP